MQSDLPYPSNTREWVAITGLDNERFMKVCRYCGERYQELYDVSFEEQISKNSKGGSARFKTIDEFIFFVLLMLKSGITFDLLAYIFQIDQPNAHRKFVRGIDLLYYTLNVEGFIPIRSFSNVMEFQAQFAKGETLIIDGTEQRVQRSKSSEIQKEFYSGKKKAHTVKSLIISTDDRYIHYVSYCYVGRSHDFHVLKEEFPPEESWFIPFKIRMDLGYQGFNKDYPNVQIAIPFKKPKGGQLTEQQKNENKLMAKERIVIEHAIGGMKRFDILSNTCRIHDWELYDKILGTCAGLWIFFHNSLILTDTSSLLIALKLKFTKMPRITYIYYYTTLFIMFSTLLSASDIVIPFSQSLIKSCSD